MMRLVTLALSLLVITIPSQAKTTAVERAFLRQQRHELKIRMQMKSVWVHALPKAQRRLAVISDLEDDGNDDPAGPDELDLQVLYRRPEVVKIQQYPNTEPELSDYVQVRLAVARARALEIYSKKYSSDQT